MHHAGGTGGAASAVIRIHPTRFQRQWWVPFAMLAPVAIVAAIALLPRVSGDEVPTLVVACGLMAGIGAFLSGGLLRQRQAAEGTSLSISEDGTLRLSGPSGELSCSLVRARGLSIRHGPSVQRLYGADVPPSLAGSGPRGAIVLTFEDGTEEIGFTGQLFADGQRQLLEAARPFLAVKRSPDAAEPTPDERYEAASAGGRVKGFAVLMGGVLIGMIPVGGLIALQTAIRGHLDPNTRWFAILLWILSPVVIVVGVRKLRKG
jgi:hypothetical protein